MSMYQDQTLTDLMGERGFKFHDVTKLQESNKYCFRFVKSIVICEVIANVIVLANPFFCMWPGFPDTVYSSLGKPPMIGNGVGELRPQTSLLACQISSMLSWITIRLVSSAPKLPIFAIR